MGTFPAMHYFRLTPENISAFLKAFPDEMSWTGVPANKEKFDYWVKHGYSYAYKRPENPNSPECVIDSAVCMPDVSAYTEHNFEEPPVESKPFPPNHWFRVTPESAKAFLETHPGVKWGSGSSLDFEQLVKHDAVRFTGTCVWSGSVRFYTDDKQYPEYVFTPPKTEPFPANHWFRVTPESAKAFLESHPGTKWAGVGPVTIESLVKHSAVRFNGEVVYSGSVDFYTRNANHPEYVFTPPAKFPAWHCFKATPENIKLFVKQFPNETDIGGDKADERELMSWVNKYGTKTIMCDGENRISYGISDLKYYPKYTEFAFEQAQSANPVGITNPGTPKTEILLSAAKQLGYNVVSVPSTTVTENNMLTAQDKQEIQNLIVDTLRSPSSPAVKSTILRKVAGFGWRHTKKTLSYVFAPAARWTQNIVFLSVLAGIGVCSYRSYNYLSKIQIPTITWESPSPSDK